MVVEAKIFYNGNIYTLDPKHPHVRALVVEGGRIVYAGREEVALKNYSGEKIDLKGYTVLPGMFDSHLHLESLAMSKQHVDLRGCKSIEDLIKKLKVKASRTDFGEWIIGRGWDHELFAERRMPNKNDLDRASKEHPILIIRTCGHVGVVNSLALEHLGISKDTKDPPGGKIGRNEAGEPNGILWEEALTIARNNIPPPNIEKLAGYLEETIAELASQGITGVATMSTRPTLLKALLKLKIRNKLKIKVRIFLEEDLFQKYTSIGLLGGFGDEKLRITGIKMFLDGSLGGRSAALKEDYNDQPGNRGMLIRTRREVREMLESCIENNLILAIHAIGDRAIEEACMGILECGGSENARIEHASLTPPSTLNLLAKTNPRAIVVQPHFRVSDWWIKDRLGERARWTYRFGEMLKKGLRLAGSSDAPVEPANPWLGVWAATSVGDDRLTIGETLKMYTIGGWNSVGEGGGVLSEGAASDFAVYRYDPLRLYGERLKEVKPWMVVVDGKIVYCEEAN